MLHAMSPAQVAGGKVCCYGQVKNRYFALDWGDIICACALLICNAFKCHIGQTWLAYGVC